MKRNIILLLFTLFALGLSIYSSIFLTREPQTEREIILAQQTDKDRFSKIYETKYWSPNNSSGEGAIRKNAIPYLEYLQEFIYKNDLKIIVDMGCGNWELMKYIVIPDNIKYLGIDIVDSVIENNKKNYQKDNILFETVNHVEDCKKYYGDLLIVKDVMQHWNFKTIDYFIKNILKNFRYAILVNDFCENNNFDIETGDYRCLDLEQKPFFMKLELVGDYISRMELKRIYLYRNPKYSAQNLEKTLGEY
jgi:hypothetical protein